MIITKMSLPRRTFLRGAGVALALPVLDAMAPALSALAGTGAQPRHRLGFFYIPCGVAVPYWRPTGEGTSFEFSSIQQPLVPFRDQTVVVSGLSNFTAEPLGEGGGPHTRVHAAWLSGTRPLRTEGADVRCGVTADQIAARVLGKETQLLSLEVAVEPNYVVGNCDNGYACVYKNTFSWRTPTTPMPMETNPRIVFERLFGEGGSLAQRRGSMRRDRSILDSITEEMGNLTRRLGAGDRTIVSEYLESVREVERRIQKAEEQSATTAEADKPLGTPDKYDEHARMMFDLVYLAYRADITRVVSYQVGRETTGQSFPWIGVPEALHEMSHHQNDPYRRGQQAKINTYHMQLFAQLLGKMRATPDGDGTLLDHSMLLIGSGMGDGDMHSPLDLPVVLAGGGCGRLKGGRHLKYPIETPMSNLLVTMLDKVGARTEKLGDSTGDLVEL
jgi:Protein of unknown function (DUF1552)